jgi:hypothetical protein
MPASCATWALHPRKIHVAEGGGPGKNHLRARKQGAGADEFSIHSALGRKMNFVSHS